MKENDKEIATENAFLAAAGWQRRHDRQRNVYYFQHMQVGPTELPPQPVQLIVAQNSWVAARTTADCFLRCYLAAD